MVHCTEAQQSTPTWKPLWKSGMLSCKNDKTEPWRGFHTLPASKVDFYVLDEIIEDQKQLESIAHTFQFLEVWSKWNYKKSIEIETNKIQFQHTQMNVCSRVKVPNGEMPKKRNTRVDHFLAPEAKFCETFSVFTRSVKSRKAKLECHWTWQPNTKQLLTHQNTHYVLLFMYFVYLNISKRFIFFKKILTCL